MNTNLLYNIHHITEMAAISCYQWIGRGNNIAADKSAVHSMREELNKLEINGSIIISEGERDQSAMLHIGETVGRGGEEVAIAVDPLEGTTICARADLGAMSVIALSAPGSFLSAPDIYMEKIATAAKYPNEVINITKGVKENIFNIAQYKNCSPHDIIISILDRQRHQYIIDEVRNLGAKIKLIRDGDISALIEAVNYDSEVDIYFGIGGAPEGVLAAAALKTIGGKMQSRLLFTDNKQIQRAKDMGINDINKVYEVNDLVKKDVIFCATGVTNGYLVNGVYKQNNKFITETLLLDSSNKKSYKIQAIK